LRRPRDRSRRRRPRSGRRVTIDIGTGSAPRSDAFRREGQRADTHHSRRAPLDHSRDRRLLATARLPHRVALRRRRRHPDRSARAHPGLGAPRHQRQRA
jgi:hypothetical protein